MLYWRDHNGRNWPVCECLKAWLPAYEAELLRRRLIHTCVDVFQTIGTAPASAGSHKTGGCVDLGQRSREQLRVARNMGAAAWERDADPNDGQPDFRPAHAHLSLKGCPHAQQYAKVQVNDLEDGFNGLGRLEDHKGARDDGPRDGVRWPLRTWREGIEWAKQMLAADDTPPSPTPKPAKFTLTDPRITESSALAVSAKHADVAYTLNDENGPIFAISTTTGKTVGSFLIDSRLVDPEALAVRSDGVLVVADIGDNDAKRTSCALYFLAEPEMGTNGTTRAVEKYLVAYPNGPRNAEAFLINPVTKHRYIISKESSGNLYRSKVGTLQEGRRNVLEHVGRELPAYVTDACFTVDGRFVLVRQKDHRDTVTVLDGDSWRKVGTFKVPAVTKPESIAVEPDGLHVLIGSEGKGSPLYRVELPEAYRPSAGVLQLSKFKRTLPTGRKDHPDEDYPLRDTAGPVTFTAPVNGVTTKASKYPRDELREMDPKAWSSKRGLHRLTGSCAVTELPGRKPHVVVAQIHDAVDDVVMIRVESDRVYAEWSKGKGKGSDKVLLLSGYRLGNRLDYEIVASASGISVTVNGKRTTVKRVGDGWFYKAGLYAQANKSNGAGAGAVTYYALGVAHT